MAVEGSRIALYSPGLVGLGHLRRNLLLARRFAAADPGAALLMLTEAREAGSFALPDSVDCITLPAIRKDAAGVCSPRRLAVDLPKLVRLRAAVLHAALYHFSPDVLIVDHLPRGALGELGQSLQGLRHQGTKLVLGLRDILEEPETVRREWAAAGHAEDIQEFYDDVWVYGDRAVYDPVAEYDLPASVTSRMRFTGYLNPLQDLKDKPENADWLAAQLHGGERLILCQVGGGQDGVALAEAFVGATLPEDAIGMVLSGPFMPHAVRESLQCSARRHRGRMHVLSMITEPIELLRRAERVITMGGYNSACEVMALQKHTLMVPRMYPRREQLIRATRLAELGIVDVLHADQLTPAALSAWMTAPRPQRPAGNGHLDMGGLDRAAQYLSELIAGSGPHRASA